MSARLCDDEVEIQRKPCRDVDGFHGRNLLEVKRRNLKVDIL